MNVTEVCGHPDRFRTMDGRWLCETCARVAAGWKACKKWTCPTLVPSDGKYCETHRPGGLDEKVCATCKGEGIVDCEEFDCHGEMCDQGETECPDCQGVGSVPVPVEAAR